MVYGALPPIRDKSREGTETLALHGLFFLTGVGTVALGPLLPALSLRWHLGDRNAGVLLGAQFLGAFVGAITLRSGLRKDLVAGCIAVMLGFACVGAAASLSAGFALGICGLLLAGFGLGRAITAINLIAGERFVEHRASAFALLNLTWGLGALVCPVAAERVMRRLGVSEFYTALAALNAATMLCCLLLLRQSVAYTLPAQSNYGEKEATEGWGWVRYALAFLAYGGIEASLSGWTSSLTVRSAGGTLPLAAGVTTSLWIGMTAGRGAAAALFLRVRERAVLVGTLLLCGTLTLALLELRASGGELPILAFGLGILLAPVFPSLCSLLLAENFSTGSNGRALAATALGSAILPWLVGVVSERTGTLQNGLLLPVALCALLAIAVPKIAPMQFVQQKD